VNDINAWLYFDGSEPEHLRPMLDVLREPPPATPEEKERRGCWFSEELDAELARRREPSVATAAMIAWAPGEHRVGDVSEDGATVRSPSFDGRLAAPSPPCLPVAAPAPRPPVVRAPEELGITSLAVEVPAELRAQMGRLPFKPRAPGPELARTMQVPVHNPRRGETAPIGDDSIEKAVAALPFARSTVGAALVLFPRLSLERYASLRAELSIWPERSAEILRRYHVMNEAARRALEEHWENELAASPEARATFDKGLAEYTAWLCTRRA
jgi:hypothetical protein